MKNILKILIILMASINLIHAERKLWVINGTDKNISVRPITPNKSLFSSGYHPEPDHFIASGDHGEWYGRFVDTGNFKLELNKEWKGNKDWIAGTLGKSGYMSETIDPKKHNLYSDNGNVLILIKWFDDSVAPFPYIIVTSTNEPKIYGWSAPELSAETIEDKLEEQKKIIALRTKAAAEEKERANKQLEEEKLKLERKKNEEELRLKNLKRAQEAKIKQEQAKAEEELERLEAKREAFSRAGSEEFEAKYPVLTKHSAFVDTADYPSDEPTPWSKDPREQLQGIGKVIKHVLNNISIAVTQEKNAFLDMENRRNYIRENYTQALDELRSLIKTLPALYDTAISKLLAHIDTAEKAFKKVFAE